MLCEFEGVHVHTLIYIYIHIYIHIYITLGSKIANNMNEKETI